MNICLKFLFKVGTEKKLFNKIFKILKTHIQCYNKQKQNNRNIFIFLISQNYDSKIHVIVFKVSNIFSAKQLDS